MAKFKSDVRALVLQDDEGVWARFAEHEFETDDKDVAARLRKVDGVTEVKGGDAEPDDSEPQGYSGMKKADLEAEIERRNAERDEADQIKPDGTKNADLIAALEADDAASAE